MPIGAVASTQFDEVGGQRPVYQVMITVHFHSTAGLQQALASPGLAEVLADIPQYYDGQQDVLVGEMLAVPV